MIEIIIIILDNLNGNYMRLYDGTRVHVGTILKYSYIIDIDNYVISVRDTSKSNNTNFNGRISYDNKLGKYILTGLI